jgi:hypothetical protein
VPREFADDWADAGAPDPAIYDSEVPYPATRAELVSVQYLAGHAIALVRAYPVQYVPLRGELLYTSRLAVEWTLVPESRSAESIVRPPRLNKLRERVATFVDNPELLSKRDAFTTMSNEKLAAVDYLLITRSNLTNAFQPLVDRKIQEGLVVQVTPFEFITNTVAGRDVPEKIRNYIRNVYQEMGVSFVLLGGDTETIPCRYAYAKMGSLVPPNTTIPCDLYYACLDGTWNGNGNSLWGEATDGEGGGDVDLLAEVYVGRAPVDTAEETAVFVEKTLHYATQGHPRAFQLLFLAEFLQNFSTGPTQGADMFEPLLPFFRAYDITWLDDRPYTTPQWSTADALQALNNSPHLALYNGHGDVDMMMRMSSTEVGQLTNQWPFLVYSVGCNAGEFDNDRYSPDCIGEELVKRSAGGAFAAILNSREGWYDPTNAWKYSGEFQNQFFDHLVNRQQTNLGMANQLAKHDLAGLVETTGSFMTYRWCYYEINLLGDPHLAWYASGPGDILDADADGMNNWQEYVAGTSSVDPVSVLNLSLSVPATQDATPVLQWPSSPGRVYSVLEASDPAGVFTVLANNLAATPPTNTWMPPGDKMSMRFYRIQAHRSP